MLFNTPQFVLGFLPLALAGFYLAGRAGGTRCQRGRAADDRRRPDSERDRERLANQDARAAKHECDDASRTRPVSSSVPAKDSVGMLEQDDRHGCHLLSTAGNLAPAVGLAVRSILHPGSCDRQCPEQVNPAGGVVTGRVRAIRTTARSGSATRA